MTAESLRVLVVNNLPGDIRRMCEHFCSLDSVVCVVRRPDSLDLDLNLCDAVILTGTDVPPQKHAGVYDREISLIRDATVPVLGICGGHQILALCFGGSVGLLEAPLYGRLLVRSLRSDPILRHLDGEFSVFTKHRFYVEHLPRCFDVLATDSVLDSPYIVKHRDRPLYGVQFHPERRNQGTQILRNFFAISRAANASIGSEDRNHFA